METIIDGMAEPETWFEEGCWITEMLNDEREPDLSIARARVAAGDRTRWHCLDGIAERYLLLSGQGVVEVGEAAPHEVRAGHIVRIPAGVRQRIRNTGEEDLVFLALCTPRFEPSRYRDLET